METPINHQKHEETKPQHSEYFKSRTVIIISVVLIELILLIGAFNLGMKVAYHKARFTYSWMNNYPKNFMPPTSSGALMSHEPGDPEFLNANGVVGQIISVNNNTIILKGSDNNEKTVLLKTDTAIRKNFSDLKITDLKINDSIIVIGASNEQGQIEAKLVRVLDQAKQ